MYLDLDAIYGYHPTKSCDSKHTVFDIVKYSNSANTNLKLGAKLEKAYDSIIRGGEVKHKNASDWNFDYRNNVLNTKWHEPKTIETYAMPCITDKIWWFNFYLMIGAYEMCSNGLLHDDDQINQDWKIMCSQTSINFRTVMWKKCCLNPSGKI